MGRAPSVRTQLLVLELGIAVPLLGLIALLLFEFQADEERQARESVTRLARLAAGDVQVFTRDLDTGLDGLSTGPQIQSADPGRCDPVFTDFLSQHSRITDLVLVDSQDRWLCGSEPRARILAREEIDCLDAVWRTAAPASSRPFLGPDRGRWNLARARPVYRGGRMVAVLAASVDLTRFEEAVSSTFVPPGVTITIVDRNGVRVSTSPRSPSDRASLGGVDSRERASSTPQGKRLTASAAVPELGWTVQASITVPLATLEHRERVLELITLCIILLTLATGLALFVSGEIARPIQALSAASRQAAAGKLHVRAPVEGSAETAEVARSFNAMLAARAEVEEALRQSAIRLRLAIQVADVGLWELDLRSGEALYSPEWKAQLGHRDDEVGHEPWVWRSWLHPEDRARVIGREVGFVADPRGHLLSEFRLRHRDGSYRWMLSRVDVLRDAEGKPLRLVGCQVDVTALRGHQEKERQLQDRLRRSEQMSSMGTLVAGVAHEVRNPLFGITATVDALEARAGLEGPYAAYLKVLREQASRLSRLMLDLLEYGRPHDFKPEPVSSRQPMDDARHQCASLAQERRVQVRTVSTVESPILIDLDRLSRALRNLIENALQFSPPGQSVVIDAREMHDERGEWVVYEVSDRGAGFREEDLGQVLEPFFSRRRGGTGLGLSIARRIAEEHGGRLRVSNRREGGAVVSLELPLHPMAQAVS